MEKVRVAPPEFNGKKVTLFFGVAPPEHVALNNTSSLFLVFVTFSFLESEESLEPEESLKDLEYLLEDWLLSLMSTLVMGFGLQY